jgi:hypothetical protein
MCMLDRRFQILLDEERYERLEQAARAKKVSIAAVIRDAIDRAFPATSPSKTRAAERILTAPDMPVPEPTELRQELEDLRGRRG